MKTFNLIKKRDQVNVKNTENELRTIVSQFIVCGEITLRLKNGVLFYISRDGISEHPSEKHFHDCLNDHWMMREAFSYRHHKSFPRVLKQVFELEGINQNLKETIEEYFVK